MSSTTRLFYPIFGVFIGPSPATGYFFDSGTSGNNFIQPLQRIQTFDHTFTVNRKNVNQLGQLGAIDRLIVEPPTVSATSTYYVADVSNERKIGFNVSGVYSCVTDLVNGAQADKNLFLAITPLGQDNVGYTGESQVVQLGNAFLNSYRITARVGDVPTVDVGWEALNWTPFTGSINQPSSAIIPASGTTVNGPIFTLPVNTTGFVGSYAAIRPGDITVSLSNSELGVDETDLKIQEFSIDVPLRLANLDKLGSRYSYAKVPVFPIDVTTTVNAYLGNLTTGNLSNIFCNDAKYTLVFTLYDPTCPQNTSVAAQYTVKGAKLTTQNNPNRIGENASTISLTYVSQLAGQNDQNNGLFITGRN